MSTRIPAEGKVNSVIYCFPSSTLEIIVFLIRPNDLLNVGPNHLVKDLRPRTYVLGPLVEASLWAMSLLEDFVDHIL